MAQITTQLKKSYGMVTAFVPPEVLRKISQEELIDRLVEARHLTERARAASSPTISKGLGEMARDLLQAAPREQTAREVKALLAKAAGMPDAHSAEVVRAQAARLEADNPSAPRRLPPQPVRAVRKTKEDPPMAVYTAEGELVGLVDPDKVTPIASAKAPAAKPEAAPTQPPAAAPPVAGAQADAVAKALRAAAQARAQRSHPYA